MGSGRMAMMDSRSGDIVAARGAVNHDGEKRRKKQANGNQRRAREGSER